MREFTDQLGRTLSLNGLPQRIVSTVPSQTELLCDLGLRDKLVGVTAYCVHPEGLAKQVEVIGGTKDLQIDKIRSLKPDLIIGNKEENIRDQMENLATDIPVWLSDIESLDEGVAMIKSIGHLCGKESEANTLTRQIEELRAPLAQNSSGKRVAYFIWKEPYMLAGPNTFIGAMLKEFGLENVVSSGEERYPGLSLEELSILQPDLLLLSSEPYAFTSSDLHEIAEKLPVTKCKIVDGELFSWYGSRMTKALKLIPGRLVK